MPASKPVSEWALGCQSPEGFEHEQSQLGRIWTFVGLASDVANDNDWFRATLGGRAVFIQRFGAEIRGFDNRCAHRFYPLRTTERGTGPIVCGFHHWRYNKDGQAAGIPDCEHAFGTIPRQLGYRIEQLDVETCGNLVFARFRSEANAGEDLRRFLGDSFPVLAKLCDASQPIQKMEWPVQANWKLCYQISVDDYHIVAVHPSTFGKGGYLSAKTLNYHRFGRHSAFFAEEGAGSLADMARQIDEPAYKPSGYRIFHIFPNLGVTHASSPGPLGRMLRVVAIFQYVPVAHNHSQMRAWIQRSPYQEPATGVKEKLVDAAQPLLDRAARRMMTSVLNEDHEVCENLQRHIDTMGPKPLLGAAERRVAWFEEAYAAAVGTAWSSDRIDRTAAPVPAAAEA